MLDRISSSSTARGPTARAGARSSSACRPTATTSPRPSSRSPRWPLTLPGCARCWPARTARPIVAGHSYGGQIITALGTDAPNVVGLVYIAAFGLDEGESIGGLLAQGPPTPALAHLDIDEQGFAWLPEDDFVNHFAADVDPVKARVMYRRAAAAGLVRPAGRDGRPGLEVAPDLVPGRRRRQAIPPDAERQFAARMGATTVEIPTSHVAMVSHPDDVVQLIETAAEGQQSCACRALRLTNIWMGSRSRSGPPSSGCARRSSMWFPRPKKGSPTASRPSGCKERSSLASRRSRITSAICPTADQCFPSWLASLIATSSRPVRFSFRSTRRCPRLSSRTWCRCESPKHSPTSRNCPLPTRRSGMLPARSDVSGEVAPVNRVGADQVLSDAAIPGSTARAFR